MGWGKVAIDGKGHIFFTLIVTQPTAITKERLFFCSCMFFSQFPFLCNSAAELLSEFPPQVKFGVWCMVLTEQERGNWRELRLNPLWEYKLNCTVVAETEGARISPCLQPLNLCISLPLCFIQLQQDNEGREKGERSIRILRFKPRLRTPPSLIPRLCQDMRCLQLCLGQSCIEGCTHS